MIWNRPTRHRISTDNPAKWSHTCLLAERRSPGQLLAVIFYPRVQTMLFHWPVSYCFSEHTCRPSHTTQSRCAFGCTSRKILNTTDICLTAARAQMPAEFIRTRGSRALPTCATSRNRPIALPGELVCGRLTREKMCVTMGPPTKWLSAARPERSRQSDRQHYVISRHRTSSGSFQMPHILDVRWRHIWRDITPGVGWVNFF